MNQHTRNENTARPLAISRRGALRGGAVLAAGAVTGLGVAAPASAAVTRNTIGYYYNVPTRYRSGWNGSLGSHPSVTSFTYNDTFYTICAQWADTYGSVLKYMTAGAVTSSWFGCVGVTVNKPGNHGTGNAFDCSAVHHTNGSYVDCNYSHTSGAGVVNNRKYAGLAWSGRKHMPEVGIVGTEPSHSNHIHFGRYKNGSGSLLLTKGTWDAWLVQYSCKAFMGVSIALDGQWGSQTDGHFAELKRRLGMSARNPFGSTTDLQDLAHTLTARGVAGQAI